MDTRRTGSHNPLQLHIAAASAMLRLLAHEERLRLISALMAEGEVPPARLAQRLGLPAAAACRHLARLRQEGLVTARRVGAERLYRLADPRLAVLLARLEDAVRTGSS